VAAGGQADGEIELASVAVSFRAPKARSGTSTVTETCERSISDYPSRFGTASWLLGQERMRSVAHPKRTEITGKVCAPTSQVLPPLVADAWRKIAKASGSPLTLIYRHHLGGEAAPVQIAWALLADALFMGERQERLVGDIGFGRGDLSREGRQLVSQIARKLAEVTCSKFCGTLTVVRPVS